jgi:hypothetical protein
MFSLLLQRGLELARKVFIDLRLIALVMAIWLCIILVIMVEIGIFSNSSFMSYGPRTGLTFMHVSIDTYYKYNMLIVMIVMHTFVTDVIADSLSPHVLNVVQDTRSRYIPHTPVTYYAITSIWAVYCSISQLFMVFIAFAQFDLLMVRLLSDLLANLFTTSLYLYGKSYNPHQYHHEQEMQPRSNASCYNDLKNEDGTLLLSAQHETSILSMDPPDK